MRLCEEKVKSGTIQKNQGGIGSEPRQKLRLLVQEVERGKDSKRNDNTDSSPSP